MMKVETMVPKTAKRDTVQKLAKKSRFLSEYPASNMIGGSSRKKKSSGSKVRKSSSSLASYASLAKLPTMSPTRIAAALSGEGYVTQTSFVREGTRNEIYFILPNQVSGDDA